ncbi:MAG TPA: 30S ribosomal protein S12 methylthiotransferase RimO [Myxococcota bacterium]|nr:30S ribosomal protein S12 methylthiotransferase RimO [Myxococcota bacterium]
MPALARRTTPKAAVHFRSLGCPKNRIDTEVMLGSLALEGYAVAEDIQDADVVVVNTCSFIQSAREESIQAILDVAELRASRRLRALLVTGCLPQRYGSELARELPEVDAFIGTGHFHEIPQILGRILAGSTRGVYVDAGETHLYDEHAPRLVIGPGHTAYVKISEGCDRVCAFCAIPGIRGRFQSRRLESVVAEAKQLAAGGAKELNLVAQDATSYGKDLPGRPRLADLLRALDEVEGIVWIRQLYVYPTAVSDDFIDLLAQARRVLPYVDVPLQHASDRVLRAMKRGTTQARQRALVERLRERVPGVTVRTTFIVGFPGESDADFAALCEFVREMRFDHVGVFRYSDEEGTAAHGYGEKVPRTIARRRHRELMSLQSTLMAERLASQVGSEGTVLVDRATGNTGSRVAWGRLASQAPEIDGGVLLKGAGEVAPGSFVRARITGVRGCDLEAEALASLSGESALRAQALAPRAGFAQAETVRYPQPTR